MDRPGPSNECLNSFNIICDFDGTITPVDSTDLILSHFALPQWEDIEQQWVSGLISSRECMHRQVGLLRVDKKSLDNLIDEIPLIPGFEEFIIFTDSLGFKPRIISDGLDYVIRRVLSNHQIQNIQITANRLVFTGDGFDLEFPHSRPDCGSGVCKCAAAADRAGLTLLIGDGRSDLCLAGWAYLVLARREMVLEKHCLEKNRTCVSYDNFFDIINFFEKSLCHPHFSGFSQYNNPAGRISPFAETLEIK